MRSWAVFFSVLFLFSAAAGQESCFPYILVDECDKDAQNYECVQITTSFTENQGGESTKILQEFCFIVGSPLFGGFSDEVGITVEVEKGTLNLDAVSEGDEIGEIKFDVNLPDFGADCPVGNNALLSAPITVVEKTAEYAELEVAIKEANDAIKECVLKYDPTDEEHNDGLMLQGEIDKGRNGEGFTLFLHLAELKENASNPGLEYNDLMGIGSPVPLYFQPITKDGFYILPAAGGTLTVYTTLSADNLAGETVQAEFEEKFEIKPGTAAPLFRRGDVNDDGKIDIADAISLLGHLFGGQPAPGCPDAADSNDDGQLNIADAITVLSYLFAGGSVADPGNECGVDPTGDDELGACTYTHCQ